MPTRTARLCSRCGATNVGDHGACLRCNTTLTGSPVPWVLHAERAPRNRGAARSKRTCPRCHGSVTGGATFCPACGTDLRGPGDSTGSTQVCPNPECRKPLEAGMFCTYCGQKVVRTGSGESVGQLEAVAPSGVLLGCAGCGAELAPGKRFCTTCGKRV